MNEKRKITDEEKRNLAKLLKVLTPNGTLNEDDILWIMNEVENGNRDISFEDFIKAKHERDIKSAKKEEPHFCLECKHCACKADEDPCKSCSEYPHPGYLAMDSKWEPKIEKDDVVHKDPSMNFGLNMMRQEEFKIPDNIQIMLDQNRKPSLVIPQLDGIKEDIKTYHDDTEKYLTSFSDWLVRIETKSNTIKSHQINLEKANQAIEDKIDKLTESLESVNAKLDILDQRLHDCREHQIMKGRILDRSDEKLDDLQKDILEKLNNIEQVVMKNSIGINTTYEKASAVHDEVFKDETKDISEWPQPKFKINDEIQVVTDLIRVKYTITDIFWSNGPASSRGYYYTVERPNVKKQVQEDLLIPFKENKDISSAKEPPKFKVGDIVKVAHDTKHKDFFVCKIKWSEHSKRWNYLISLDLEDISGAFWRMEEFLIKTEDYSEPLFKVGDKVKLKHGKVVYEVYSITYFMNNKKKVYRYKIGHGASTTHYENENRLIKA